MILKKVEEVSHHGLGYALDFRYFAQKPQKLQLLIPDSQSTFPAAK